MLVISAAVPYLLSPLENVNTYEDQNVTFFCMAAGVPQPTVTWLSNGRLLLGQCPAESTDLQKTVLYMLFHTFYCCSCWHIHIVNGCSNK